MLHKGTPGGFDKRVAKVNLLSFSLAISYNFWMFVDPAAVINGADTILSHASHPQSPWFMKVSYYGPPDKRENVTRSLQFAVELQAPPHFHWKIEKCQSGGKRVIPGQWHQVDILWDKKELTLTIDGIVCGATKGSILKPAGSPEQRFSTRRTPFIYTSSHKVKDLSFNGDNLFPQFYRFSALASRKGVVDSIPKPLQKSKAFYASFHLASNANSAVIRLPSEGFTVLLKGDKLITPQDCSVFQVPRSCNSESCFVEVERNEAGVYAAYVQNTRLPLLLRGDSRLCSESGDVSKAEGLKPNSPVQLFNKERSDLLRLGMIRSSELLKLMWQPTLPILYNKVLFSRFSHIPCP